MPPPTLDEPPSHLRGGEFPQSTGLEDANVPPSRNAPCPCGSGKKYKRCCRPGDLAREGRGRTRPPDAASLYGHPGKAARLRESAQRDRTWELGAIPLPSAIDSEPNARPVALMVATRDAVLALDVVLHLSGEPEEVAAALSGVLDEAMELTQARPGTVAVHHPEVAQALVSLRSDPEISVQAIWPMDRVYEPARSLTADVAGVDLWPPMSSPQTWTAWGLPEQDVREFFEVAAACFRTRPWEELTDGDVVGLGFPDGSEWGASVMGNAGEVFGLSIYEEPSELLDVFSVLDPAEAFSNMQGRVLTVMFEEAQELPRPMRRELARKGWEVADPAAYPVITAINTPGGGMSREDLGRLTRALEAIPAWIAHLRRGERRPGTRVPHAGGDGGWRHPASGLRIERLEDPFSFAHYPTPRPAGPRGSGARPGAFLPLPEGLDDVQNPDGDPDAVEVPLDDPESEGLPEAVVAARTQALLLMQDFATELDWEGLSYDTVRAHALNVGTFLRFLLVVEGVPVGGVDERDLRQFLHDWHPRNHTEGLTVARRMPVSLSRFFGYLSRQEDLHLPWAEAVLEDREYIRWRLDSCPGGDEDDPAVMDWRAEVFGELDRRLLLPDLQGLGSCEFPWGTARGVNLLRELQRSWIVWRDELIEGGMEDPAELEESLLDRQWAWEVESGLRTPEGHVSP